MISDHFWPEPLELYCQQIHQTCYLLSQWLIDFQPHYLSSLPTFSFQWWPRSYGRKRTANWWGLVPLPEGARDWSLSPETGLLWCPLSWQQHQPLGLLFFVISIYRTVCTLFRSQNFFPCTFLSIKAKAHFALSTQLDSPTSLLSHWAPAGHLQVNPGCI